MASMTQSAAQVVTHSSRKPFDRRIVLTAVLMVSIALGFWMGSRVPALNEKATMGGEVNLDSLGFNTVFAIQADHPTYIRILYTTINWMDTNLQGMTFGILFASVLMTLLSMLKNRSFKGSFANSALGIVIGAPLGVCVNCAAPIAKGMAASGTRLETTLATMISSPTMNIIILTMLFSLFPFYLAMIKVGLTLGFLLLVIPLLSRYVLKKERIASEIVPTVGVCAIELAENKPEASSKWWPAIKWLGPNLLKNLWFVVRKTVPLMVLAGFLGAVLISLLPWDSLADIMPKTGIIMILTGMTIIAIVGTFLPVPIAFDIIVCAVLLAAGMPVMFVAVLLFTLGIFSVYSFFIVWESISRRAALVLYAVFTGMGVVSGVAAHEYNDFQVAENRKLLLNFIVQSNDHHEPTFRMDSIPASEQDRALLQALAASAQEMQPVSVQDAVTVESIAFADRSSTSEPLFTRQEGGELGIDQPYEFSFFKMDLPFVQGHGRSVASGDVHNDGWVDILLVAEAGLSLFANNGGASFFRQDIETVPVLDSAFVVNAALVDLNDDGWLDIFFSTFQNGDHVIYNQEGRFSGSSRLPTGDDSTMTATAGFSDIDRDGDLDLIIAKWSFALASGPSISSNKSYNMLLRNEGGTFESSRLSGSPGAPTTILLTDYNGDPHIDLIIGNDFAGPDFFYIGDGQGGFRLIDRSEGLIPHSTHDTMSAASGDINNDLIPELFMGDIARYPDDHPTIVSVTYREVCETLPSDEEQAQCVRDAAMYEIFANNKRTHNVETCMDIENIRRRDECVILFFVRLPHRHGGLETCATIPDSWQLLRGLCQTKIQKGFEPTDKQKKAAIPQTQFQNVLLIRNSDGAYEDHAEAMGVNMSGWVWNSKFGDFDNDGYLDLFTVNGSFLAENRRESNHFFWNNRGKRFENRTEEMGVTSHRATSSATYIDFDNDGDLDILTIPVNGPIEVFLNNSTRQSIAFEILDEQGNRFGLGTRIIIHYGKDGSQHQLREIQGSGGFISYDAPIAYFGLDDVTEVTRVEIQWSTGEETILQGPLPAGARYRIRRAGN